MLERVEFKNIGPLRDTVLPLEPLTLIIGPNGSGKTTALRCLADPEGRTDKQKATVGAAGGDAWIFWHAVGSRRPCQMRPGQSQIQAHGDDAGVVRELRSAVLFSLSADIVATPTQLTPTSTIGPEGQRLSVVLDRLRDDAPERFEMLNEHLGMVLPEFDRILFRTPDPGDRLLRLRRREDGHIFDANELSSGTLIALAILTLAWLPTPPAIVCLEEPDRGIHPRLLVDIYSALRHLAYPADYDDDREPVQVVVTTHNPFFLHLFADDPEEVVIASKHGLDATFQRLTDIPNWEAITEDIGLGEAWYVGVLGGVPERSCVS